MNAREKFGIEKDATVKEVKSQWQKDALINHPDYGGNTSRFLGLLRLYKAALKEASKCNTCKDTKKVEVRNGIHAIKINCPDCK